MTYFIKRVEKFLKTETAKTVFAMSQSLKKRPSEIVGGFGHPLKDFLFDVMMYDEFIMDEEGNIRRHSSVTVDQLIEAHEKGLDELAIAEMLGVKVVRKHPPTH